MFHSSKSWERNPPHLFVAAHVCHQLSMARSVVIQDRWGFTMKFPPPESTSFFRKFSRGEKGFVIIRRSSWKVLIPSFLKRRLFLGGEGEGRMEQSCFRMKWLILTFFFFLTRLEKKLKEVSFLFFFWKKSTVFMGNI